MIEKFQYGDVLVEVGKLGKWVVTAFTSTGMAVIDKVQEPNKYHPHRFTLLPWGTQISPTDLGYVKVGTWDFDNNVEIDDET